MVTKLESMLRDFSKMRVHRRRRLQAAIRSMDCRQWRSANLTTIELCESRSRETYNRCDKRATFDSLCATNQELGVYAILQTVKQRVVYLTNMRECVDSMWCDARVPFEVASTNVQLWQAEFGMEGACT